jgi:hypothetical protein
MAHTYSVSSAVRLGDIVTIMGTVDGFPVTITPWFSALSSLANTTAVQNFVAPLMLAAAIANGSISPVTTTAVAVTAAGTFSQ